MARIFFFFLCFSKDRTIYQSAKRRCDGHYRSNARCGTMSDADIAYVLKAATVFARTIRKSSALINHFRIAKHPGAVDGSRQSAISWNRAWAWENIGKCFTGIAEVESNGCRTGIRDATITSNRNIINGRRSFLLPGRIEEKSEQVIEKERFCQNTGYTGEDWVEIGMRGNGEEACRRKVPVEGMEADIYPRQCVTGSAKSAMMNVLAGINPQCTPPLPSSSAVPTPPPTSTPAIPPRTIFPTP